MQQNCEGLQSGEHLLDQRLERNPNPVETLFGNEPDPLKGKSAEPFDFVHGTLLSATRAA